MLLSHKDFPTTITCVFVFVSEEGERSTLQLHFLILTNFHEFNNQSLKVVKLTAIRTISPQGKVNLQAAGWQTCRNMVLEIMKSCPSLAFVPLRPPELLRFSEVSPFSLSWHAN